MGECVRVHWHSMSKKSGNEVHAHDLSRRLTLIQKCGSGGGGEPGDNGSPLLQGHDSFFHEGFCGAIIVVPSPPEPTAATTTSAAPTTATMTTVTTTPPPPPPPTTTSDTNAMALANSSLPPPPPPATVTLRGLARARSTLEDFVSSYFMFYGLDPAAGAYTRSLFSSTQALSVG